MPAVCVLDNFEVHKNEEFLKIAESLKPELKERRLSPVKGRVHISLKNDILEVKELTDEK